MMSLGAIKHRLRRFYIGVEKDFPLVIGTFFGALLLVGPCAFCIISSVPEIAFPLGMSTWDSGPPLNREEIEDHLDLAFPESASNLQYDSSVARGGFISFSFTASPEIMESFLQSICTGVIFQGYNPFDARDSRIQVENSYPVMIGSLSYYSYSLNTPPTSYGNRCWDPERGMIEILLDTADPDLYHLQYHLSYSGSYNFVPTPVTPIWVPPNNPNALTLNDWHTAIPRPELTAEPDD